MYVKFLEFKINDLHYFELLKKKQYICKKNNIIMKKIFYLLLTAMLCFSCVSKKKFSELSQKLDDCNQKTELQTNEIATLGSDKIALHEAINKLIGDTALQAKAIQQNR